MDYLDFAPMTEQEMTQYLGEMENLEKALPELIKDASSHIESLEESLSRNSFHRPDTDTSGSSHNRSEDTVYLTLMSAYRDLEHQQKEVAKELLRYTTAEEKLAYVKRCLKQLPGKRSDLIEEIYIKKVERKAFIFDHQVTMSWVSRNLKKALSDLVERYNSRFKNQSEGGAQKHENL